MYLLLFLLFQKLTQGYENHWAKEMLAAEALFKAMRIAHSDQMKHMSQCC